MSAEDLTTLAGVSVQQDLALVSLLGLTHVERNGHHFIDGMSFAPGGRAGRLRPRAPRPLRPVRRPRPPAHRAGPAGARLARLPRLCGGRRHGLCGHAADAGGAEGAHRAGLPRESRMSAAAPARPLRQRRGARRLHDRADAGAGRRPRRHCRRHPHPRRGRQDGADARAHGQAGGAQQAHRRRGALLRPGRAPHRWSRRASRRSHAICSSGAPSRRCRSSTTSSTWRP